MQALTYLTLLSVTVTASLIEIHNKRYNGWTAMTTVYDVRGYNDRPQFIRLQVLDNDPDLCLFSDSVDDISFQESRDYKIGLIMNGSGNCSASSKLELAENFQQSVTTVFFYASDPIEIATLLETKHNTTLRVVVIDASTANFIMGYLEMQQAITRFQGGPIARVTYTEPETATPTIEGPTEPATQRTSSSFNGGSVAGVIILGLIIYVAILHVQSQSGRGGLCVRLCGGEPARVLPIPIPPEKEKPARLSEKQADLLIKSSLAKEHGVHELSDAPCSICLDGCSEELDPEKGVLVVALPCRHRFHKDCIIPWLTTRKARCPMCNDDVSERVKALEES